MTARYSIAETFSKMRSASPPPLEGERRDTHMGTSASPVREELRGEEAPRETLSESSISLDVSYRFRRPVYAEFDEAAREQEEAYAYHFCAEVAGIPAPSSIVPSRRGFCAVWNLEEAIDTKEARQIYMALHVACIFHGPTITNRDVPIPGESYKDRILRLASTPRQYKKTEKYIYCDDINTLESLRAFVKSKAPEEEPELAIDKAKKNIDKAKKKDASKEKDKPKPFQLAVEDWLFDPLLYHKPRNTWTCLTHYDKKGNWKQKWVKTYELSKTLQKLDLNQDWWISQNEFSAKKRDFDHVSYMQTNYIDLDWEDSKKSILWAKDGLPPARDVEACRDIILGRCHALNIPEPSLIIFSGNGFHLKWIYADGAIPKRAFPRWMAVQEHLIAQFKDFGADPAAKDAARVLRLAGSKNMKPHTVDRDVRVIHHIPVENSFNYYANNILPFTQQEVKEYKAAKAALKKEALEVQSETKKEDAKKKEQKGKMPTGIGWAKMANRRYQDILKLIELRRDSWGTVPRGTRELMVFWGLVSACQAGMVTPGNFSIYQNDLISRMGGGFTCPDASTLRDQLQSTVDGDRWKEWKDQTVSRIYNISTETLIEKLLITTEEQKVLDVLFSKAEKLRRRYERRREEHQPRAEYLAEHTQEKEKPWEAEGISRRTWFYRQKKRKEAEAAALAEALAEEERLIAEEVERRKEEEKAERKLRAEDRKREFWESPRGKAIIEKKKAEREAARKAKREAQGQKQKEYEGYSPAPVESIEAMSPEDMQEFYESYEHQQREIEAEMEAAKKKRKNDNNEKIIKFKRDDSINHKQELVSKNSGNEDEYIESDDYEYQVWLNDAIVESAVNADFNSYGED